MSGAIEWMTKDATGAGSYGVVTCPGPFLGEFVMGSAVISNIENGVPTKNVRTIFQISLFCLSSGGWIPFVGSYKGISDAENIFRSLSLRSHGLNMDQKAIRFVGEPG